MSSPCSQSWCDRFESLKQEAHVWYCDPRVMLDPDQLAHFVATLSEPEARRYENIRSLNDQRAYLVAHVLVRKALSLYVNISPRDWVFGAGERGKPEIENASAASLRFNLTHTENLCACVVTRDAQCGIDAEYTGRKNKFLSIAKRMFSVVELETLESKTRDEMRQYFFYYWTLREAYVKARGAGLSGLSKMLCFKFDEHDWLAGHVSAYIEFMEKQQDGHANDWQFEIFKPDAGHVVSVALQPSGVDKTVQWQLMEL